MTLHEIEKRILEINKILADKEREKKIGGPVDIRIHLRNIEKANRPLLEEKLQLETERQFILDRRDSLFWRAVWNVLVPIVVSIITVVILRFLRIG